MKKYILLTVLLSLTLLGYGQQEGSVWAFGYGGGLNFSGGSPVPFQSALGHHEGCASVASASGQLLFYTDGDRIYNRTHQIMPNGVLFYGLPYPLWGAGPIYSSTQSSLIVPVPGEAAKYYVFSLASASYGYLWYSIVDMTLDNGLGDVVPGKKNILLDTGPLSEKMTAVKGNRCNVWMVVHRQATNEYLSYEINASGINTTPVVSAAVVPTAPIGVIKISPDRQKMAAASYGGPNVPQALSLYSFNAANGAINFIVQLDSAGTYYGACFSPDNTKLYATAGTALYQFNISLPGPAAMIQSRVSLLPGATSDLKQGPDGKIYFTTPNSPFIGAIAFPDLPGIASGVNNNVFSLLPNTVGYYGLPNEVVVVKDTSTARKQNLLVCFRDSVLLQANTFGNNFIWNDGSAGQQFTAYTSGIYTVSYQTGCKELIDTFIVDLAKMPLLVADSTCPGTGAGKATARARDNTNFTYTWKDAAGRSLQNRLSSTGDQLSGLNPGDYTLQLSTIEGCDTTVNFTVFPYPEPLLTVSPADTTIRYGDSILLHSSGAQYYVWWPSGPLDTAIKANPVARPAAATLFTLMGMNEYGCRDTTTVRIDIDYSMPDFIPNAFSPNGDGVNDVFRIENITYQQLVEFKVFNRWGQLVYETTDAKKGWDGSQNGKPCVLGTYYYLIRLNYPDGRLKTFRGDIALIR